MRATIWHLGGLCVLVASACGHQDELQSRPSDIVGGTAYSGLPAVGSLVYDGYQHCTATVIAPRKLVTAAHCVYGYSASRMQFVIGPSLSAPDYVLAVESLQAHPYYSPQGYSYDIGIATLAQNAPVASMPVNSHMDSSWIGDSLFFVGYGVDNGYQFTGVGVKRAVWIAISDVYPTAFRYDHSSKNTCSGDSGGPAFAVDGDGNYLVAGVTSYGDYYCASYGVDTRVDAYLDFLSIDGTTVDPVGGCQGETYVGRCEGSSVIWCEDDQVHSQDCAAEGKVCTFDQDKQYYACRAPGTDDPCNGETWVGRCEGDVVIWCDGSEVKSIDCGAEGRECGYNAAESYYDCL